VIHLDTNFLIDALVAGNLQEAQLVAWLSTGETAGIGALAWGEFLCGLLSPAAEALAQQLLPSNCCPARSRPNKLTPRKRPSFSTSRPPHKELRGLLYRRIGDS